MNPSVSKKEKAICQKQRKALLEEALGANQKRREEIYKFALLDFKDVTAFLFQLAAITLSNTSDLTECNTNDPTVRNLCYQSIIAQNTVKDLISAIILAGINRPYQTDNELQERLFQIACRELFLAKCSGQSELTLHIKDEEHIAICKPRDCLVGFEAETVLGFEVLVCESCTYPIFTEEGVPETFSRIVKCIGYDQTKDVFIVEDEDGRKDFTDIKCIQGIVIKEIHDPDLVNEIKIKWGDNSLNKTSFRKTANYYS